MPSIFERWRRANSPTVINVTVSGDASTQVLNMSARELYQSQDNLQAVVNFLSNSIAQLPLKVYRRDGETERTRDRDSVAALLLWRPNDYQTSFEFIRGLAIEYYVFGCVYVWVVPDLKSASGYSLHIVPTEWVQSTENSTAYKPGTLRVRTRNNSMTVDIPIEEFTQFKTYSPGNPGGYLSPISGLRQSLFEQTEAGRFRRQLWKSSGRLNAQITRPKDVQPWNEQQREKFVTAFREAWGSGGSKAGSIPLMEDGMEIKPFSTSFKEQEWSQSVIFSREAVAAAYGVNPSLIWHSNTQTYASAKDNARALYSDCLGPVLQMLQQRINAFLLPMIGEDPNVYVEFDLTEKLKGNFEERASILQSAVGAPWLTRNEARADNNLPPIEGGNELITPLNVTEGGQASPQDTQGDPYNYPGEDNQSKTRTDTFEQFLLDVYKVAQRNTYERNQCDCKQCKKEVELRIKGKSDKEDDEEVQSVIINFLKRQAKSVIPKIGTGTADYWDAKRWDKELAEDLGPVLQKVSDKHGKAAAEKLKAEYVTELTEKYIETAAQARAKKINAGTLEKIQKELDRDLEDDEKPDIAHVYEVRQNTSDVLAKSAAGAIASFAIQEAAHQAISSGAERVIGKIVEKEWVTGENARESHQAMNGERVPLDADFSNGQHWPGEDIGDPAESCGCNCTTEVVISRK